MARQTVRRQSLQQSMSSAAQRGMFRLGFFGEVYAELRKAEWPTRQEATRLTGVVIAVAGLVGAILGLLDFLFSILARNTLS
ncbi:MAG: preprotein translocase subunit SecE [Chloroflexota bacterium]|nr:preprotein translocase subunit SecE [Chloroflexota bacterium]MDE2899656.1 preprotein translocase subunit SecE [Chloroflexota bacterium]MDE2970142.1 preprotein translocase subunit SecE [Chloroflexota bacterium]